MANGKPQQRKHSAGSVRYYQIRIFAKLYMYSRYYKPSTHTQTHKYIPRYSLRISFERSFIYRTNDNIHTNSRARSIHGSEAFYSRSPTESIQALLAATTAIYILFLIVFSLLYSWSVRIFFYVLRQHPRNTRSFRDVEDYLIQAKNMWMTRKKFSRAIPSHFLGWFLLLLQLLTFFFVCHCF